MKKKLKDSVIIDALTANGGWIAPAAKALGMRRTSLHRRIAASARLRTIVEDLREEHLDLAENKLLRAVQNSQPWAICFFLKCQGKNRGWIENRHEISGPEGGPIQTEEKKPDYSKLSKDELKQLHELSEKLYAKN